MFGQQQFKFAWIFYFIFALYVVNYAFNFVSIAFLANIDKWVLLVSCLFLFMGGINSMKSSQQMGMGASSITKYAFILYFLFGLFLLNISFSLISFSLPDFVNKIVLGLCVLFLVFGGLNSMKISSTGGIF